MNIRGTTARDRQRWYWRGEMESAHDDIKKAEWYEKYIMEKVPNNYTAWTDRRSQNAE